MFKVIAILFISFVSVLVFNTTALGEGASEDIQKACEANPSSSFCTGYNNGENSADIDSAVDNPVIKTLKSVITVLSFVAGILAVIFVIYGGFKYITSTGDAQKAASGRQTIIYSLVGLIVVVLAHQLIIFALNRLL